MAMTAPAQASGTATAVVDGFLIARGGPFFELQRQLGLLHERALHAGRRAMLFVAIAWGVPLLLSLLAGRGLGPAAAHPFLLDPGTWARFLVAIAVFVLMEGMVEQRLRLLLRQLAAPLRRLKETTLAACAVGATRHPRAVERELFGRNMTAAEPAEAEPSAELPDPSTIYARVGKLGTLPVSKSALLPLGVAALLPLVAAGATQMPVKDILKIAKGLLL
jgi:hypothetical protein